MIDRARWWNARPSYGSPQPLSRLLVVAVAVAVAAAVSGIAVVADAGSNAGGSLGNTGIGGRFPLAGVSSNPFVEASPLVVGVVCSDGVLLLAVHAVFSEESNPSEWPLMVRELTTTTTTTTTTDTESDDEGSRDRDEEPIETTTKQPTPTTGDGCGAVDLPRGYRGPFRIHALGGSTAGGGGALACAGFRTDGTVLADEVAAVARSEERVFGGSTGTSFLADAASSALAKREASEGRRSLSCAGLLATTEKHLYVVDATGSYRVRAHALGRGSRTLHRSILSETDWSVLDRNKARTVLLAAMGLSRDDDGDNETKDPGDDKDDDENENEGTGTTADTPTDFLPKGSRVEMAIVEPRPASTADRSGRPQRKSMQRLFASSRL